MGTMLDEREIRRLLLAVAIKGEGSAEAFERLYRLCAPLLLGIVQRIVGRRELAEEVLHDAFAAIWRSVASFDPSAPKPLAWMVAIARNRAIDVRASHDVSRAVPGDPEEVLERLFDWSGGEDEGLERRRASAGLRECLDGLKAAERQALVLAYHHGLSHGELAAHLRKPLGTVKTWVRKGMANLRQCLEATLGALP